MAEQTSKISVTNISVPKGASSVRKTTKKIYTATKLTGPIDTDNGKVEYKTEIIRYDDAKGNNGVTIGERNNTSGKIIWNSNASTNEKKNGSRLGKTSASQISDVKRSFENLNFAELTGLNSAAGNRNLFVGSGDDDPNPSTFQSIVGGAAQSFLGGGGAFNNLFGPKRGLKRPRQDYKGPNGPLVYPVTLRQSDQDYIKFDMLKYVAKGFGAAANNISGIGNKRETSSRTTLGTVVLPIPGGITDTNATQWGEENMTVLEANLANAAYKTINEGAAGAEKALKGAGDAIKGAQGDLKRAVGASFAGAAAGVGDQVLTRATGEILNPNMELLFKGPSLRQFSFQFKLAPRSSKEAETVIAILRFFKQGMLPMKSPSNLFLESPNTFKLGYYHRNREHRFINRFKECALQNVTVEYTPDGNYATFDDGVMTAYTMTLSFNELEPLFSNDMDDGYSNVGF